MVYDKDFDVPLALAKVTVAETGETVETSDEGNYVFGQIAPGTYTLVFSKEGYARQVKADVVVSPGRMTEASASLSGDFTEMEEFIVQDIQIGGGTEIALLELRLDSPALMDSVSAELMSQAGASNAADALKLVTGTSVQEGKYAVVRGLPDRYVNSQINSIRLPTADTDKRAVQLDQFPSDAIESIQVSKTFTPDQQGDASGGAVNVILKGIPDETVLKFSTGASYNTQVTGRDDFLTYEGADIKWFGADSGNREFQPQGESWDGAVGVTRDDAPYDYKFSMTAGGKYDFDYGIKFGGLLSFFYDKNSSFFEDGINDRYWVRQPGDPMTPRFSQGTPEDGDFKSSLFDVTRGVEEEKWGGLGVFGIEFPGHKLNFAHLYTKVTEDAATLLEDTRSKEYYFPGYDPDDPSDPGNLERDAAPYLRTQTLQYTERITKTYQVSGEHTLPVPEIAIPVSGFVGAEHIFKFLPPVFDWYYSQSTAELNQPDKRQFSSLWWAEQLNPGRPPRVPPFSRPAEYRQYKPSANFTLGNLQRVWKDIVEESEQYAFNLKFPFTQWTGAEGYFKFGLFNDVVNREYNQESFSNFNDNSAQYFGDWDEPWSDEFPQEDHPISAGEIDVDYLGYQNIEAWYYMADVPLISDVPFIHLFKITGGVRHEDTHLSIINIPEEDVLWFPPGVPQSIRLEPGQADVEFKADDVLPSISFTYNPIESLTLRGAYTETVARQTFKELTPIQQQEFLGADIFIGNPSLQMSALKNYDLRLDYAPYQGGLVSASYFYKDITNPIENVQRIAASIDFTTAVNYPEGELSGYEFEVRQDIGRFWSPFEGLSLGGNATFIESEVTLPEEEAEKLERSNIDAPMPTRDMTNAPEHLYNLFLSYDMDTLGLKGTNLGIFYTVKGDTLVAGATQSEGYFVPNVYETEFGTLNASLSQKIGDHMNVKLQAKNLLDPEIETVYRSEYIEEDVVKTSYKKGREFSLTWSVEF